MKRSVEVRRSEDAPRSEYPWHAIKYCEQCRRMTPHGGEQDMSWCDECAMVTKKIHIWQLALVGFVMLGLIIWGALTAPFRFFGRD